MPNISRRTFCQQNDSLDLGNKIWARQDPVAGTDCIVCWLLYCYRYLCVATFQIRKIQTINISQVRKTISIKLKFPPPALEVEEAEQQCLVEIQIILMRLRCRLVIMPCHNILHGGGLRGGGRGWESSNTCSPSPVSQSQLRCKYPPAPSDVRADRRAVQVL